MKLKITAIDIKNGKKHRPDSCPIALALNRQCGRNDASVTGQNWWWMRDENQLIWPTSLKAREFMSSYDSGEIVEPLELEL